jgi:hypothetical protein
MLDERPTAAELIAAVAEFIETKAAPQLDARTAFHARVAVNALRIVERELDREQHGGNQAELERLVALCNAGDDADLAALNRELCARIADGRIALDDAALRAHLMSSVLDRIAVDNPKYPSLTALEPPRPR